jgi:molecular chaperone DnaJ
MADYYKTLGVDKAASDDQLKSAYRKLAKQFHPDMYSTASPEEKKKAEDRFKEISHAYDVLSDKQKRAAYDTYGNENGPTPGSGGSGFSGFGGFGGGGQGVNIDDLFSGIFGGFGGNNRRKSSASQAIEGDDLAVNLVLTFEEAAFGVEKEINIKRGENCPDCGGTGAKDGKAFKTCARCNGKGTVNTVQQTMFGQFATTVTCPECKGKGKIVTEKCQTCTGKGRVEKQRTIKINVPAGIDNDQRMTYYGEGEGGYNGGGNGNLIILIKIKPHKLFTRKGNDIFLDFPISITQAALGGRVSIPTLNEPVDYTLGECVQSGDTVKLKGKGIKMLKKEIYGDLYVKFVVEIPKGLTKQQKDLLFKLESSFESKQYPKKKEFFDKM